MRLVAALLAVYAILAAAAAEPPQESLRVESTHAASDGTPVGPAATKEDDGAYGGAGPPSAWGASADGGGGLHSWESPTKSKVLPHSWESPTNGAEYGAHLHESAPANGSEQGEHVT